MNKNEMIAALPDRIRGLGTLAYNLWWSWSSSARELFSSLDLRAWRESGHNPIRMLATLSPGLIADAVQDHDFLDRYDAVMDQFEAETGTPGGW
ncbi:MAG: DUF3417 domain-containing protein, partial [Anaerolineae bacterium]|nr:DUF3417 domain-containing protein [Anaerolineae bacterium]